jgi:hypothetical protein
VAAAPAVQEQKRFSRAFRFAIHFNAVQPNVFSFHEVDYEPRMAKETI